MTKRRRKKHKPEEIIAGALLHLLDRVGVETLYIEPGSPWENGYAESCHSRFRDEVLAMEIIDSVRDARALTATWRDDYNTQWPHSSLDDLTPVRSPPRVRLPPRPRPLFQPHTLDPLV